MATPGLLYVTMQPRPSLPAAQFHDWYNSEHGPLRLRLPFVTNGFRYRAVDDVDPEWVALYDITEMEELTRPTYLALRGDTIKTPREKATMAQIAVDRKLYDLLQDEKAADFQPLEDQPDTTVAGNVLISNTSTLTDPANEDELKRWYKEEHIPMLARVSGWRRSRFYVTAAIDTNAPREFVALHEFTAQNGLGGAEHKASMATPWRNRIADMLASKTRRVYNWVYTFGPAPRELASLTSPKTQPAAQPSANAQPWEQSPTAQLALRQPSNPSPSAPSSSGEHHHPHPQQTGP